MSFAREELRMFNLFSCVFTLYIMIIMNYVNIALVITYIVVVNTMVVLKPDIFKYKFKEEVK